MNRPHSLIWIRWFVTNIFQSNKAKKTGIFAGF